MKIVLQRVSSASITVDESIVGDIGKGYVVLLGIGADDDCAKVEKMVAKLLKLRLFPDENGKTNLSIESINGEILVVSQFTLYADSSKGNRPSFINAAPPELAEELYDYFIKYATGKFTKVATGIFGAAMQVELVNDGPFTLILEG